MDAIKDPEIYRMELHRKSTSRLAEQGDAYGAYQREVEKLLIFRPYIQGYSGRKLTPAKKKAILEQFYKVRDRARKRQIGERVWGWLINNLENQEADMQIFEYGPVRNGYVFN
jgi:hypothetical protein